MFWFPKSTMVISISAVYACAYGAHASHLRGHCPPLNRKLLPHPKRSSTSIYKGCMEYSESELSQRWIFNSDAPACSWEQDGGSVVSAESNEGSNGGSSGTDGSDDSRYGYWEYDDSIDGTPQSNDQSAYDDAKDDNGNFDGNDDDTNSRNEDPNAGDDDALVSSDDLYDDDFFHDPLDDFNIETCTTYENLWLWDLSLSCNSTDGDLSSNGCACPFAEELMDNGVLSCDGAVLCPDDCMVCAMCMELLGCDLDQEGTDASQLFSITSAIYIVATAIAMLIFALIAYYARQKRQGDQEWNRSLLDKRKDGSLEDKTGPSFMYISGDLGVAWKPLPSDQEYAKEQLQPICTMSTASTGRYLELRIQPDDKNSTGHPSEGCKDSGSKQDNLHHHAQSEVEVPTMVEAVPDTEDIIISPMQTNESSDEESCVFEDALQSPMSLKNDGMKT